MASAGITSPFNSAPAGHAVSRHKLRLAFAWLAAVCLTTALTIYGAGYYKLGLEDRPLSPLHPILRPSGTFGLKLGMLGVAMFLVIFIYPLRKRWRWLGTLGKTTHWLDFHVLLGIAAPVMVTFHSSFKFQGLAGIAYWIMIIVALSGFAGRYIYAKIPRSLHAAELDMGELNGQAQAIALELSRQSIVPAEAFSALLRVPDPTAVRRMSLLNLLWTMFRMDAARPLQAASLRRHNLGGLQWLTTLGGLLKSNQVELEEVIAAVRRQSALAMKMAFLDRVRGAFHLWHVIHRPFSISFAILVLIHIGVVVTLGYF